MGSPIQGFKWLESLNLKALEAKLSMNEKAEFYDFLGQVFYDRGKI